MAKSSTPNTSAHTAKSKTLFLDRDGTIIVDKNYMYKIEDLEIIPEALEALKKFAQTGEYNFVFISNQSGIGRDYFTEEQYWEFQKELYRKLEAEGIVFDGSYFCPHTSEDNCSCRKPKPGMVEQARRELGIPEESASYFVGDKGDDIKCGKAAGCITVRIKSDQYQDEKEVTADHTVKDLLQFYYELYPDAETTRELKRKEQE